MSERLSLGTPRVRTRVGSSAIVGAFATDEAVVEVSDGSSVEQLIRLVRRSTDPIRHLVDRDWPARRSRYFHSV